MMIMALLGPNYMRRAGWVLSRFEPGKSSVLCGKYQKVTTLANWFSTIENPLSF